MQNRSDNQAIDKKDFANAMLDISATFEKKVNDKKQNCDAARNDCQPTGNQTGFGMKHCRTIESSVHCNLRYYAPLLKNSIRANKRFSCQNRTEAFQNNQAKNMRYAHLIFGIIFFVIFLITGKFMRWDFPDKDAIPQDFRILMRSRHIYILLSSLIHIALGVYLQIHAETWRRVLQIFASVLLFAGSVLFVWAFVYETYTTRHFSDLSRFALYTTLAGTILHLFGGFKAKK
jgi:hypothetical protein